MAKALFQLIPFGVGGAADSLIQHRAEEMRSERLRVFFDEIAEGEHCLSEEIINSNDFLHSYFATLNAVIRTKREEKIQLLAMLLKSSASSRYQDSDTDEFDEFVSVLETLSLREFRSLVKLRELESAQARVQDENDLQHALRYWPEFQAFMIDEIGILNDELPSFLAKIERTGLYLRLTGGFMDYEGDIGYTTNLFERLLYRIEEGRGGGI